MRIHGKKNEEPRAASRRGSALVLSLVAVATVVVLAASFSRFASAVANRQAQAVHRKHAFYMAEAGLAEAFAGFSCGKSGAVGTREAPALLGGGVFWVEAVELQPGVVRLDSTGMVGTGSAKLSLVARRGEENVAALGVFSAGHVSLGEGSLVDAYDSTKGNYSAQTDKSGAALGSNADITLIGSSTKPTIVRGDVTPGADNAVSTLGTVTVSGSTSPALGDTVLPPIDVPGLELAPPQVHGSPYPFVIPSGGAGYESLTVEAGAEVIIQGPAQVVLGSLTLASTAQLSFDTGQGPVELFVTDAVSLAAQSLLTTSSTDPDDVLIQVPGATTNPVTLRSSGAFHGVIYAPEASVVVGEGFELFGALVAHDLTFDGAAKLHFDKHLATLAAEAALPAMLSWRLVELASTSTDLAADPFDYLGVDKNVLPPPSGAHLDQVLSIDYYDSSSVYHRYTGLESSFDWSVVQTVIVATRDGEEVLFPRAPVSKAGAKKSPGVAPVVDGPMI
jgi:hypothetical protein